MTTFFGGVFIDQETLETAGINYPIKLEYYKRINENKSEVPCISHLALLYMFAVNHAVLHRINRTCGRAGKQIRRESHRKI